MAQPPAVVLEAFGLSGEAEPLPDGQGRAYAVGSTVLRPGDDSDATSWVSEVMSSVPEDGFRVPRPRRTLDGRSWVADGWTAWERAVGRHRTWDADWQAALGVAVRFHEALRPLPRPRFLDRRHDVFAEADRMAWAERPLPTGGRLGAALARLAEHFIPAARPRQVVHADLAGNLLWHDRLAPAVIDLSPTWRPGALGAAQVVVDATLWYGADLALAATFLDLEPGDGRQLLLRALVFRLAVDAQLEVCPDRTVRWDETQVEWDLEHAGPLAAWATRQPMW
jgi:uncharacterized protein (TIGR02569 family)